MNNNEKFTDNTSVISREFKIATYDIGFNNSLKISSIMKYQQDIGDEYLSRYGFTHDYLYNTVGIFFAVSHMRIHIFRLPRLNEKIRLTTWCTGGDSKFRRCFRFETAEGERLIESIALLPVIDVSSRRAIRPSKVAEFSVFGYNDFELSIESPKKVAVLENYKNVTERKIRRSDLDYNSHVNNTVYADLIIDSLDETAAKKEIEQLDIYFKSKIMYGENITVLSDFCDNTSFICGKNEDTVHFTAKCIFKN